MKVVRCRERRDPDISEISRSLKALARELEIPVPGMTYQVVSGIYDESTAMEELKGIANLE